VQYSQAAAQILKLINDLEYRLKSRIEAMETLRQYWNTLALVPSIETLEQDLPDISYDQIATHFNSYLGYMRAALGDDFDTATVRAHCQQVRQDYRRANGCEPSARAISLAGRCQSLPLCTEAEVRALLSGDPLGRDTGELSTDIDDTALVRTENIAVEPVSPVVETGPCELVLRYLDTVYDSDDLQQLPPDELVRIRVKYASLYRFLRQLKEARGAITCQIEQGQTT
jgi:hypothetical protein